MRKLNLAIVLMILSSVIAAAQEVPRFEIFGGYSYLRGKGASTFTRVDENTNMHGWNLSVVGNLNDWFALVGDFSGHYSDEVFRNTTPQGQLTAGTSKNVLSSFSVPAFHLQRREGFHRSLTAYSE